MTTTLPAGEQPVLRIVPMPADTNAQGTLFGGWVMSQVDIAGSIPAWARARGPVVTVAVNSFVFREPVFVGDLVSLYARICKVGRTSITVDVEVFAQRSRGDGLQRSRRGGGSDAVKVHAAQLTFIAVVHLI